jgi:hypothetical protein
VVVVVVLDIIGSADDACLTETTGTGRVVVVVEVAGGVGASVDELLDW